MKNLMKMYDIYGDSESSFMKWKYPDSLVKKKFTAQRSVKMVRLSLLYHKMSFYY